jgi:hypothetical protein
MITTALVLAVLTFLCGIFIFIKLPEFVKRFLTKHDLFTDISATGLIWLGLSSLSGTLVAVIASAMAGVLVSVALIIRRKEQDFNEPSREDNK